MISRKIQTFISKEQKKKKSISYVITEVYRGYSGANEESGPPYFEARVAAGPDRGGHTRLTWEMSGALQAVGDRRSQQREQLMKSSLRGHKRAWLLRDLPAAQSREDRWGRTKPTAKSHAPKTVHRPCHHTASVTTLPSSETIWARLTCLSNPS